MKLNFKLFKIVLLATAVAVAAGCEKKWDESQWPEIPQRPDPIPNTGNYSFSGGTISNEVLNNYLSRAITMQEFLCGPEGTNDGEYGTEDDERMLLNIGAKFIGRAIFVWNHEDFFLNDAWLANAKAKIERMHEKDPEMMFQGGMFETVSTKVNDIPVPDWVFTAFGKTPEERNFSFDSIRDEGGTFLNQWGEGTCVPDMSREEAQMWFYYMGVKYMEIGIEALHCGQVMLMSSMGDSENGYSGFRNLMDKLREAAKTKALHGTIIFDGHLTNGGIVVDGQHLFDFTSFPLRVKEVSGEPLKGELKKGFNDCIIGYTQAGMTPSGWYTDRLPYILEFDNFGTGEPGDSNLSDAFIWGYDEISWFSQLSDEEEREWVKYAVDYLYRIDPVGYIEMPGLRVSVGGKDRFYRCNTQSDACPTGRSLEKTIKSLWN